MTTSAKKKREKKQRDFQVRALGHTDGLLLTGSKKPKLKVGKTKAKQANFTDTSFKSKILVVAAQSLHQIAPSEIDQLSHHLSLLTHHSDTTRRESLSYLTTHLPPTLKISCPSPRDGQAAIPVSVLIPALMPMILDMSRNVRSQLLALFNTLPSGYVEMYASKVMLYITSAMTHLSPEIRTDSTKFLGWLISVSKDATLRSGGWAKGLRGLIGVLGWGMAKDNECIGSELGAKHQIKMQHLSTLLSFLQAGLLDCHRNTPSTGGVDDTNPLPIGLQSWTSDQHMLPMKVCQSNAYSYLGLFSMVHSSGDDVQIEDLNARRRWLIGGLGKDVLYCLQKGVEGVKREGGEIGRLGGRIMSILEGTLYQSMEEG